MLVHAIAHNSAEAHDEAVVRVLTVSRFPCYDLLVFYRVMQPCKGSPIGPARDIGAGQRRVLRHHDTRLDE
jgi:hypothetical protein